MSVRGSTVLLLAVMTYACAGASSPTAEPQSTNCAVYGLLAPDVAFLDGESVSDQMLQRAAALEPELVLSDDRVYIVGHISPGRGLTEIVHHWCWYPLQFDTCEPDLVQARFTSSIHGARNSYRMSRVGTGTTWSVTIDGATHDGTTYSYHRCTRDETCARFRTYDIVGEDSPRCPY